MKITIDRNPNGSFTALKLDALQGWAKTEHFMTEDDLKTELLQTYPEGMVKRILEEIAKTGHVEI